MRNDPTHQPRLTFGRVFVLEYMARRSIIEVALPRKLTVAITNVFDAKINAAGFRYGTDEDGLPDSIFRLSTAEGDGRITVLASDLNGSQWQTVLEWLRAMEDHKGYVVSLVNSPCKKKQDYNNIYGCVQRLIKDVETLLKYYF